jgi:hypothetical protein
MADVAYTPSNIPTGLPFCGRLSPAGMGGLRNKQYFKMLLSHGDVCFFPSPYCMPNCAHLLSACCKEESGVLYSEAEQS